MSPLAGGLGDPTRLVNALVEQAVPWLLAAAVVSSVLLWERRTLRSLWLQRFRWQSIGWGFALLVAYYTVLLPLGEWVRRSVGLPGFGAGMERVIRFPIWYRVLAVVGAGVVEEVLFRGFSVTRIAMITLFAFQVLHAPLWGWGFALGGLVSGAGVMAFFVWRRDLLAMIVFHLCTDAWAFVAAPSQSEWWKDAARF